MRGEDGADDPEQEDEPADDEGGRVEQQAEVLTADAPHGAVEGSAGSSGSAHERDGRE